MHTFTDHPLFYDVNFISGLKNTKDNHVIKSVGSSIYMNGVAV